MSKFKVGDRVAVYTTGERYVGEIIDVESPTALIFRYNATAYSIKVHPKQCHRLIKKTLRRIKVKFSLSGCYTYLDVVPGTIFSDEEVEFIEVRRKK